MKFLNYLNESNIIDGELVDYILKDCKPFLKDWQSKYKQEFLWSGRQKITKFEKRKMRLNRVPKDTPEVIHKEMDKWFNKKFGVKARSQSLFCTFDGKVSASFGNSHIVFPIGNYKLLSSNKILDIYNILEDMFLHYTNNWTFNWDEIEFQERDGEFLDEFLGHLENGNYKFNQHNDNEQMLICKEYYLYYPAHITHLIDFKHEILQGI